MLNPYAPQEVAGFSAVVATLLGRFMLAMPEWSSSSRVTIEHVVRVESEDGLGPPTFRLAKHEDLTTQAAWLRWKVRIGNYESTKAELGDCLLEIEAMVRARLLEVRDEHVAETRRIEAICQTLEGKR